MTSEQFVIERGKEHQDADRKYVFHSISSLRQFLEDFQQALIASRIDQLNPNK